MNLLWTQLGIRWIEKDGKVISPFHDIPLYAEGGKDKSIVNMVVEIPRWTNAKVEVMRSVKRIMPSVAQYSHRFPLERNTTRSSKISRRASLVLLEIASLTRDISGTTALYLR